MKLAALLLLPLVLGCSTVQRDEKTEHSIQKVFVNKMRVRRPVGAGADPAAGPGGIDYRSDPLPNERMDCETLASLFSELDLPRVRMCLAQLDEETEPVSYLLKRDARPSLVLEKPEQAPDCLRLELPVIPVPREIVFQSPERGQYTCYAARIDLEANQIWGELKLPTDKLAVVLRFPLAKPPTNSEETIRVLAAWALTPIWGESSGKKGRQLTAKIVPDGLCRRCLGNKDFQAEGSLDHLLWP
jgi:hypothetical protein